MCVRACACVWVGVGLEQMQAACGLITRVGAHALPLRGCWELLPRRAAQ